jgi:hypothetical protein
MKVKKNTVYLDARKEVMNAESDHTKVKCIFHLGQPVNLHDGIARMADWVHKTGKLLILSLPCTQ